MNLKIKTIALATLISATLFAAPNKTTISCKSDENAVITVVTYLKGAPQKIGTGNNVVEITDFNPASYGAVCQVIYGINKKQITTQIYLEQGDNIQVQLKGENIEIAGSKIAESKKVDNLSNQFATFYGEVNKKIDSDSALILIDRFEKEINNEKMTEKTVFANYYNQLLKTNISGIILFVGGKTKNNTVKNEIIKKTETLITAEFPSAINMDMANGIGLYTNYLRLTKGITLFNKNYDEFFPNILNKEVCSILASNQIQFLKQSDSTYINSLETLSKYMIGDEKIALKKTISNYHALQPGKPAIDFQGTTPDGKIVKLSDLKGKAVYVDAWATWCGPCRREIPYLDTIITDYANKIHILKISLDDKKDYEKWKTTVTAHESKAINIIADGAWKSQVAVDYGINGIPRFMLFDKNGNIISINAARPSSKEIREILDKL